MNAAKRVLKLVERLGPVAVAEIARHLQLDRRVLYDPINVLRRKRRLHAARAGRHLVLSTQPLTQIEAARATLRGATKELHAWLQHHPGLDQATIARHWQGQGWKRSTVQYRLQRLEAQGLAQRRGQTRGATWHAV